MKRAPSGAAPATPRAAQVTSWPIAQACAAIARPRNCVPPRTNRRIRPSTMRAHLGHAAEARSSVQQLLLQHHMNPLIPVDHLRDTQVGGEAAQRVGLLAR